MMTIIYPCLFMSAVKYPVKRRGLPTPDAWQERGMRVSRQKAAENRERIIEAAGALFREKGFDRAGVADIMKAADLTHGGFYGHFESKDDLTAQASERAMARAATNWGKIVADAPNNPYAALL